MAFTLNVAIVDDLPEEVEALAKLVERYCGKRGYELVLSRFNDSIRFIANYRSAYDLVFMDIDMPDMNGMQVAWQLRQTDEKVVLIFVTNLAQFAIQGYDVSATDYILKPVEYNVFAMKIRKAVQKCMRNHAKDVFVLTNGGEVRFSASSILYVEINAHSIIYHTESGDYSAYGTMKKVEQQLPPNEFFRCNYCFLVNLRHVSKIDGFIAYVGPYRVIISHPRKKKFIEALHGYYGNSPETDKFGGG